MNAKKNLQTAELTAKLELHANGRRRAVLRMTVASAVLIIAVAAVMFLRRSQAAASAIHYETQSVTRGTISETVNATGTLAPVNSVEVGSEVSGTMKTVEVDYNDRVKVGQVLARIDTSKLAAQVLQSESGLEAARAKVLDMEATLKEGEAQLSRLREVRELSGGKVPSQYEFEAQEAAVTRARAGVASSKAAVSQAQGTLDMNKSDLQKAVIRSPIEGVVLTRAIEPGQTVAATFASPVLFKLAESLARLELQVDVDEADVGRVSAGQKATFTVDAYPDKKFPATITQVRYGSKTTEGVVTYTTVLKVSNDDLSLRPGMTATAVIATRMAENALLVPNAALRFEPPQALATEVPSGGGGLVGSLLPHPPTREAKQNVATRSGREQKVYVFQDGQIKEVPVVTGLTDGMQTEITGGTLESGMNVITANAAGR